MYLKRPWRTMREAALKHDVAATFMAKPMENEPGSAMHMHQSLIDKNTGKNVFTNEDGSPSDIFFHFIGGMQHYIPEVMPFFAPGSTVSSFAVKYWLPSTLP